MPLPNKETAASHSSLPAGCGKPDKPRADFPLYPHAVGKWAKTIRGRTYYFGNWADPEGALRDYLAVRDDLFAGRTPRTEGGPDVRAACNAFIRSKRVKLDADQLSPRSWADYDKTCRTVLAAFGEGRKLAKLGPRDFEKRYATLAAKHGVATLGREVTITRGIFRHAYNADLTDKPVKFGPTFRVPSKAVQRKHKAQSERQNGERLFAADEIR